MRNVTGSPQTVALTGSYGRAARLRLRHDRPPRRPGPRRRPPRSAHPRLWAPGHPVPLPRDVHRLRLQGQAARRLLHLQRDPDDRRHPRRAADAQRPPARPPRREPPRAGAGIRRGARPRPAAAADGWVRELGATLIRAHYPLNPEMHEMADRDGILLWYEMPVWGVASQYLNQPAWVEFAHSVPRGQHPHQPEPPVDPAVEHRQRAADAGDALGGGVHRRRRPRWRTSSTRPGRSGWRSATGRASRARRRTAARRARLQRLLRLVRRRRGLDRRSRLARARSSTACAPATRRRRSWSPSSASRAAAAGRSRSAGPTSSSPTRPPTTWRCSRASRGCRARSGSPCRTSPRGRGGPVATRGRPAVRAEGSRQPGRGAEAGVLGRPVDLRRRPSRSPRTSGEATRGGRVRAAPAEPTPAPLY